MQETVDALGHLLKAPYWYFAVAAIALLAVLFGIHYYRRAHRGIIPFRTEGGKVEISPKTLRSILQLAVNGIRGVDRAECHHIIRGQSLGVKVDIHLQARYPLREVEHAIKDNIRRALSEQFGLENVSPIDIRVIKVVGDSLPRRETQSVDATAQPENDFDDDAAHSSNDELSTR